jgi:iron(III) transport system substrate-binding protein
MPALDRRFALAIACAALGVAGCGADSPATDSGAADSARDLVVYSGRSEELVGPLIERFEERSGVDVSVRYGDSAELAALVREEGGKSPADLVWMQDAGSLDALESADLLAPLPSGLSKEVPAEFRSSSGTWTGTSARARVIAYDTRELGADEVPASVFDLTKARWKGKIGWAPSNASFQAFVTAMRASEGDARTKAWLEAMEKNDTQRLENNVAIRDAIATGELQLGLINHYYVAEAKADDPDYPVGVSSPAGDVGAMVNVAGVGIVDGAAGAKDAADLARYLLDDDAQQYFVDELKEYAVRPGFETPTGVTPLAEIEQPEDVDLNALADHQGTVELLQDAGLL